MTLFGDIAEILADEFCIDVQYITPDSTFDSMGCDSLDFMSSIVEIEERFNIEIPIKDVADVVKVGDLVGLVGKLTA